MKHGIAIFLLACLAGVAADVPKQTGAADAPKPTGAVPKAVAKPSVAAPFAVPKEAEVLAHDESGRTWRMNGRLKGELSEGKKSLYIALFKAKYEFKHETALDEAKTHLLSTWVKGKEVLLLMIWADRGYTYFSWGTYTE
ncbi:MAG: hypothetical protein IJT83_01950 [Victivallales bacterium]|nr:hypothetical protein [Victivallales bacterium]